MLNTREIQINIKIEKYQKLFKKYPNQIYFSPNYPYDIDEENPFIFDDAIIRSECNPTGRNKGKFRYYPIGSQKGVGKEGDVNQLAGIFTPSKENSLTYISYENNDPNKNRRLIKNFPDLKNAKLNYRLSRLMGYLKPKPIINNDNSFSFLMDELTGNTFSACKSKIKKFTFKSKLNLLIDLLNNLMELYKNGYYHRDLHEGNIIIDSSDEENPRAYIIDFGYSTRIDDFYNNINIYDKDGKDDFLELAVHIHELFEPYSDLSNDNNINIAIIINNLRDVVQSEKEFKINDKHARLNLINSIIKFLNKEKLNIELKDIENSNNLIKNFIKDINVIKNIAKNLVYNNKICQINLLEIEFILEKAEIIKNYPNDGDEQKIGLSYLLRLASESLNSIGRNAGLISEKLNELINKNKEIISSIKTKNIEFEIKCGDKLILEKIKEVLFYFPWEKSDNEVIKEMKDLILKSEKTRN